MWRGERLLEILYRATMDEQPYLKKLIDKLRRLKNTDRQPLQEIEEVISKLETIAHKCMQTNVKFQTIDQLRSVEFEETYEKLKDIFQQNTNKWITILDKDFVEFFTIEDGDAVMVTPPQTSREYDDESPVNVSPHI